MAVLAPVLLFSSCCLVRHKTTTSLNLRACPDASSKCAVIRVLPPGTKLKVLGREAEWLRVAVPIRDVSGWVHSKYVKGYVVIDTDSLFRVRSLQEIKKARMRLLIFPISADDFVGFGLIATIAFTFFFYLGLGAYIGTWAGATVEQISVGVVVLVIMAVMIAGPALVVGYVVTLLFLTFMSLVLGGIHFGYSIRNGEGPGIIMGLVSTIASVAILLYDDMVLELQLLFSILIVMDVALNSEFLEELFSDAAPIFGVVYNKLPITICLAGSLVFAPVLFPTWIYWQVVLLILFTMFGLKGVYI